MQRRQDIMTSEKQVNILMYIFPEDPDATPEMGISLFSWISYNVGIM